MEKNLRHKKHFVSSVLPLLLALALVVGPFGTFGGAAYADPPVNTAPGAPTGLRIELLEETYALATKDPSFSWVVNDADQDEVQTAYRIVVAKRLADVETDTYVKDSGWVNSPTSAAVKVDDLSSVLEDNELYFWQVQTKDSAGEASPLSEPAPFRTALGTGDWTTTQGVWLGAEEDIFKQNGWTDYTVEQEVTITVGGALGIAFRLQDSTHGYFWQFRTSEATSNPNALVPHYFNGSVAAEGTSYNVGLTSKGITLHNNVPFKLKIEVVGNKANTWIDTGDGYVLVDANHTLQYNFLYGPIGYRTGGSEGGYVDNVQVTTTPGSVELANLTFDAGSTNYFSGATLTGGHLTIPAGQNPTRMNNFYPALSKLGNFAFFRSPEVNLDPATIEKAVVSMAARGTENAMTQMVDLYVNGSSVGFGPARDYRNADSGGSTYTRAYYNAYDVTEYLRSGDNVIGALAVCTDSANRALLAQMDVYYKDGTKATLTNTATGWKSLDGTAAFGNDGSGITAGGYFTMPKENVNTEKYPSGWFNVDFDDSEWLVPITRTDKIQSGTSRILEPYTSENTRRVLTDEPAKTVTQLENGHWRIDLGKEIIGSLSVDWNVVTAGAVTVRMGEQLNADGSVRYQLAASPTYEETWTLKEGANVFRTANMKNFRYIEIIGFDGTIGKDDIKGWAMQQAFDENAASFTSSNEMLNREWEMSQYTIKATNQDLYVDSQARERRAYEGDLLVNSNTSYSVSSNYSLARHSNAYLIDYPTWPSDYKLFSIEMAWQDYLYTGNADALRSDWTDLKSKLTSGGGDQNTGLWDDTNGLVYKTNWNDAQYGGPLIDWPTGERDGYVKGYYSTIFNAEYVRAYEIMSKVAAIMGDTANATLYQTRSDRIRENLLDYAYDPVRGAFYDSLNNDLSPNVHYSMHASAYALAYGIFDSEDMKEKVAEFVGNNGYFKGSIYATYFVLRGLYNADGGAEAAALLTNTDSTSTTHTFAYVLDVLKATTAAEAWSNGDKSNLTLSHPWGASPGCSIVQGMFGILPTSPGFDTFNIKVQPGGIESASLKTPSVKGPISVSYTDGNSSDIGVTATIPANTKATVTLPDMGNVLFTQLKVDGVDVAAVRDGSGLSVELGSGTHMIALGEGEVLGDFEAPIGGAPEELLDINEYQIMPTYTSEGAVLPAADFGTVTYMSSNESIVTVSAVGNLKALTAGNATIRVRLELDAHPGVILTQRVAVKCRMAEIDGLYIRGVPAALEMNATGQAILVAVMETGAEIDQEDALFTSSDLSVVEVTADGEYEVKAERATPEEMQAALTAVYTGSRQITEEFPAEQIDENILLQEDFSGGNSLFSGLSVQDGALYVPTGKSTAVIYNDPTALSWEDYTVSGKFKINTTTFTLVFRAESNANYYLWQYEKAGYLKRHLNTTVIPVGGLEKILLPAEANFDPDGYNDFAFTVAGNKITAYLNGVEIGDPIIDAANTYPAGTIGVRTGSSESFWIDDLKVAKPTYQATKAIFVEADAGISQQPQDQWAAEGDSVTFEIGAIGNPVSYQWQIRNGSTWGNIDGATQRTYTTAPLRMADNGKQYRCVVSNTGNSETSDIAMAGVLATLPEATEIAQGITDIPVLTPDQVQLLLPGVPDGYTVSIKQSSDPSVIATDGGITPQYRAKTVTLIFEIEKQLDGTKAYTAPITVIVPALSGTPPATAEEAADSIVLATPPSADGTEFLPPGVPSGFEIFIASVSPAGIIGVDGSVIPPEADSDVDVVFLVVRTDDNTVARTAPIRVRVPAKTQYPLEGILLSPDRLVLNQGNKGQFGVSYFPIITTDAKAVTYTVQPAGIVSVDANGNYTALKSGSAVITATSTVGGHKAFCTVAVLAKTVTTDPKAQVQSLALDKKAVKLGVGASATLKASLTPNAAASAWPVTWKSSDPGVASVTQSGAVRGLGEGVCTITASAGGKQVVCEVTVMKSVTKLLTPLKKITLKKKSKVTLPVVSYDKAGSVSALLKWSSSKPGVATVDAKTGKITAKKAGKAKITATALNGKKIAVTVKVVNKAKAIKKIALTKAPKALKIGKIVQLRVKLSPAASVYKSIVFKSSKPGVISVDKAGNLIAKKKGKAVITVKAGSKFITKTITVK